LLAGTLQGNDYIGVLGVDDWELLNIHDRSTSTYYLAVSNSYAPVGTSKNSKNSRV
jgi:hypothetical protein